MKIQTNLEIAASADAVWDMLGERFGDVAHFAGAINASSLDRPLGEGAVRTCDLKAFGPVPAGTVTEELTLFDRDARSLTFVVRSGVPGFMRYVENAWVVKPAGEARTKVTSTATFNLAWWILPLYPLFRFQLARGLRAFCRELDTAVTASADRTHVAAAR